MFSFAFFPPNPVQMPRTLVYPCLGFFSLKNIQRVLHPQPGLVLKQHFIDSTFDVSCCGSNMKIKCLNYPLSCGFWIFSNPFLFSCIKYSQLFYSFKIELKNMQHFQLVRACKYNFIFNIYNNKILKIKK